MNLIYRLCLFSAILVMLMAGCDPKNNDRISPPIIETPLLACASTVTVKGFIPGAKIDIYANDTLLIGGGISDAPWGQSFAVNPELIIGWKVTATQTFDGVTSSPSQSVMVISAEKFFGGGLPKPEVESPAFHCGGAISVRNLAKGAKLRVFADGSLVGQVNGCGEGQWLSVSPKWAQGQTIHADHWLCSDTSDKSDPVIVLPEPTELNQLEMGEIYEGGKYVNVYGIMQGARVITYNGTTVVNDHHYAGGGQVVRLNPQPSLNDQLTATQEFCGQPSIPSNPTIVLPCSEMPAPELGKICPGDPTVKIVKGVLGAWIRVYRGNGVLVASGGGNELQLFAAAQQGQNYYATQELVGTCVSPESVPVAVGCEDPEIIRVRTPNGGRAVAVSVDMSDDNRILVASETGGIFRSVNGGDNWAHVTRDLTFNFTDVHYLPWANDVAVASARGDTRGTSGGGIYRTTDNGSTWKQMTNGIPSGWCTTNFEGRVVSVDPEAERVWVGTRCGLFSSDNNGLNWRRHPSVTGYSQSTVFSLETPDSSRFAMTTWRTVLTSKDGGASFDTSMTGLPDSAWWMADHNQLAMAPNNWDHLYLACYYRLKGDTNLYRGVYQSLDFGQNWSNVLQTVISRRNRPPFVRCSNARSGKANQYEVYFGTGASGFKRAVVSATNGGVGNWEDMNVDHADPCDVGFASNNATPILHLSDGGLHRTEDDGKTWKMAGAGPWGYNALQITEVTGQLHQNDNQSDLYFGTQDNDLWASVDQGVNWSKNICCEGFYIDVMRDFYAANQTRVSGVTCGSCKNFITEREFKSYANLNNPSASNGNPTLLKPSNYVQNSFPFDSIGSLFMLTTDNGSSWDSLINFPEGRWSHAIAVGPLNDPVIYSEFIKTATFGGGSFNQVGLKKITGSLSAGGPIITDVPGIQSLGQFPTMFAWYPVYGVDPKDPDFIVYPDMVNDSVMITTDGGATWRNDSNLTRMVTWNGEFRFNWRQQSQISCISFNPECRNHIVVGTQQAGLFVSYDRGESWGYIPGTKKIPYIGSVYFSGDEEMIISSYGRSLWRLKYSCPDGNKSKGENEFTSGAEQDPGGDEAMIYDSGTMTPMSGITQPSYMPDMLYFFVQGGDLVDYQLERKSDQVESVTITGGKILGFNWQGKIVKIPFKVSVGESKGGFSHDKSLTRLVNDRRKVKGMLLRRRTFKAVVLASRDLTEKDLPRQDRPLPQMTILNRSAGIAKVVDTDLIRLIGKNFKPNAELSFFFGKEEVKLDKPVRTDASGKFRAYIPQDLPIGGHSLIVRQKGDRGELETAVSFVKTVWDSK